MPIDCWNSSFLRTYFIWVLKSAANIESLDSIGLYTYISGIYIFIIIFDLSVYKYRRVPVRRKLCKSSSLFTIVAVVVVVAAAVGDLLLDK